MIFGVCVSIPNNKALPKDDFSLPPWLRPTSLPQNVLGRVSSQASLENVPGLLQISLHGWTMPCKTNLMRYVLSIYYTHHLIMYYKGQQFSFIRLISYMFLLQNFCTYHHSIYTIPNFSTCPMDNVQFPCKCFL